VSNARIPQNDDFVSLQCLSPSPILPAARLPSWRILKKRKPGCALPVVDVVTACNPFGYDLIWGRGVEEMHPEVSEEVFTDLDAIAFRI
jgi:hypothetical protein